MDCVWDDKLGDTQISTTLSQHCQQFAYLPVILLPLDAEVTFRSLSTGSGHGRSTRVDMGWEIKKKMCVEDNCKVETLSGTHHHVALIYYHNYTLNTSPTSITPCLALTAPPKECSEAKASLKAPKYRRYEGKIVSTHQRAWRSTSQLAERSFPLPVTNSLLHLTQ